MYSVVRFFEDQVRQETLNVGVIVLDLESRWVIRLVDREEVSDPGVVRRFEDLLRHLLERAARDGSLGEVFLDDLAHRRFAHFRISEPAQISLEEDIGQAAEMLCRRLVDLPSTLHTRL